MGRDLMDHHFLGPRIADKLVLSLIVMSLYFQVPALAHAINASHGVVVNAFQLEPFMVRRCTQGVINSCKQRNQ